MDNIDTVMRIVVALGVLALVLRGGRIEWKQLAIALLIIAILALIIQQFL